MHDALSTTFAALADPTRRAILARLSQGESSVSDLAKPFAMSAPAITKHLKVLERAKLISRSKNAQWRPCRLEAAPLATAWRARNSAVEPVEQLLFTLKTGTPVRPRSYAARCPQVESP